MIESPLLTYAFLVLLPLPFEPKTARQAITRKEVLDAKVVPMSVVRLDDNYMAERNTPKRKTLAGKLIAVVGCGTIGGYLADMLVKAGAGTSGGEVLLIDPDTLYPQNLGRHRLGFPSLFQNKATALGAELRRMAPGARVRALPVPVEQVNLGQPDLVVDATGEEALGHWLAAGPGKDSALLTVWIEGPGTAGRAFLRAGPGQACYRCLCQHTRLGGYRAVVGELDVVQAGGGCEGLYVPFPATASVQAASLGAEMAVSWVNDEQGATLRTLLIDHSRSLATPDCNPTRSSDCPICGI